MKGPNKTLRTEKKDGDQKMTSRNGKSGFIFPLTDKYLLVLTFDVHFSAFRYLFWEW